VEKDKRNRWQCGIPRLSVRGPIANQWVRRAPPRRAARHARVRRPGRRPTGPGARSRPERTDRGVCVGTADGPSHGLGGGDEDAVAQRLATEVTFAAHAESAPVEYSSGLVRTVTNVPPI